jgi:hypothetical protein
MRTGVGQALLRHRLHQGGKLLGTERITSPNGRPTGQRRSLECASSICTPVTSTCCTACLMMGLRAVGRDTLEAVDCLEIHGTNVRRPLITDTPPLTLQQLFHGRFWQLAPRHQGALPLGALPVAPGAAQPFDVPALAGPGAMRAMACAGAIALCTVWIRA